MTDPRILQTAKILVDYSTKIKKGEKVRINTDPSSAPLAKEIYKLCIQRGAYPSVNCSLPGFSYAYYKYASNEQLKKFPEVSMYEAKKTQAWITISGEDNTREFTNVNHEKLALRRRTTNKLSEWILNHTRWVGFDYPTNALAQDAEMSLEEYEDFVYGAVLLDWKKWSKRMEKLRDAMNKTNEVRIITDDTDLKMSIKGRNAVIGDGRYNMPDGEVFTAPIVESVEGHINFQYPAIYNGNEVEGVRIEFKNGKAVNEKATKNQKFLTAMLNTDKRARYLGELGIGANYGITKFTKNILFDEKIGGSIHIAFGSAYKECKGTNKSALHWDMIKDLRQGGKLYFDGRLVQKNGKFRL